MNFSKIAQLYFPDKKTPQTQSKCGVKNIKYKRGKMVFKHCLKTTL